MALSPMWPRSDCLSQFGSGIKGTGKYIGRMTLTRTFSILLVCSTLMSAQLTMTVVTAKSTVTLTEASLLVNSSRGYLMGSGMQGFGGVYVTDTVIPPEGVEIAKKLVRWQDISKIEFLEFGSGNTRARITSRDGKSREVFVFYPTGGESFYRLTNARITGKLKLGESVQEVEINTGLDLKSIEIAGK